MANVSDGNTQCHDHDSPARGYFTASAPGTPDARNIARTIMCPKSPRTSDLLLEQRDHCPRQHDDAILRAFTLPDNDHHAIEVQVLYPQLQTLCQTQARPIEQFDDRFAARMDLMQKPRDFTSREDDRDTRRGSAAGRFRTSKEGQRRALLDTKKEELPTPVYASKGRPAH